MKWTIRLGAVLEIKALPNNGVQAAPTTVTNRRRRPAQVQKHLHLPGMASRPALPADAAEDSCSAARAAWPRSYVCASAMVF